MIWCGEFRSSIHLLFLILKNLPISSTKNESGELYLQRTIILCRRNHRKIWKCKWSSSRLHSAIDTTWRTAFSCVCKSWTSSTEWQLLPFLFSITGIAKNNRSQADWYEWSKLHLDNTQSMNTAKPACTIVFNMSQWSHLITILYCYMLQTSINTCLRKAADNLQSKTTSEYGLNT